VSRSTLGRRLQVVVFMLEWLTGRKKRSELAEYSRLRAKPTRALPADLAHEESGEILGSKRMAIQKDLRRSHHDPEGDTPHFTTLIASSGQGVVTIPMPEVGSCIPMRSTATGTMS